MMIEFGDSVNFDSILKEVINTPMSSLGFPDYECDSRMQPIDLEKKYYPSLLYGSRNVGRGEDSLLIPSLNWRIQEKKRQFDTKYERDGILAQNLVIQKFQDDPNISWDDVSSLIEQLENEVTKDLREKLSQISLQRGKDYSLNDWKFPAYLTQLGKDFLDMYQGNLSSSLQDTPRGYYRVGTEMVKPIARALTAAIHRFKIQGHKHEKNLSVFAPGKYCLTESSFLSIEKQIDLAITGTDMLSTSVVNDHYNKKIEDLLGKRWAYKED